LSFLIPYALYPVLWVGSYGVILYLAFRRRLYHLSLPIIVFSLLYLYPMAKGYAIPVFARAAMLLFPGFCILIALAAWDIVVNRGVPAVIKCTAVVMLAAISIPSLLFDWAYVTAMARPDVRTIVHDDLKTMIGSSPAVIGVGKYGGYWWTVRPAVEALKSKAIIVKEQGPKEVADFFLLGRRGAIDSRDLKADIDSVEKMGKFKFMKVYSAHPEIFGRKVDLVGFPLDMAYPFPTILLFRSNEVESPL
jgi:hypothetical protein